MLYKVLKALSLFLFSTSFRPVYKRVCIALPQNNFYSLLKARVVLRLADSWYNSSEGWNMYNGKSELKGFISKSHCFGAGGAGNYLRQHTMRQGCGMQELCTRFPYILFNTSADKTWKYDALLWKVSLP